MQPIVRIGGIKDQDGWRRDDLRRCTPSERVDMLLQLQSSYFAGCDRSLVRVAHVKRMEQRHA